jgi:cell division protein FtsI (penicillin-binding protein 3)
VDSENTHSAQHAASAESAIPAATSPTRNASIDPSEQSARTRRWARGIVACTAVVLSLTLIRVAQLKVAPPEELHANAGRRMSVRGVIAQRGEVLDRRGRPLAMSLVGYKLYCDPAFIYESGWEQAKKDSKTDPNAIAECDPLRDAAIALAPVLQQAPQAIHEMLRANAERRYVVLAEDVTEAQVDALKQLDLKGVGLETKLVRENPAGGLAGQIVGRAGTEQIIKGRSEYFGQAGIEFAFNKELAPVKGQVKALRDAWGRTLWINRDDYVPGDAGQDVRLTIDLAIQESAERHLTKMVKDMNAGGGRVIVMDAGNGDILAMADILQERPRVQEATRDPARRIHPSLGRNRNFTDPYEPGSTMKSFVWARATQLGLAKPTDIIQMPTGSPLVTSFGRVIHNASKNEYHSWSWKDVLVHSVNTGMVTVGLRMTHAQMQDMVRDFGFGSKSGVGIPGESAGLVTPAKRWSNYTQSSVAFGHEIAVTPIQMVRAFSAFARPDGTMASPRMVLPRGSTDSDTFLHGSKQVITPAVLAEAKDALKTVLEGGTARYAQSLNYRIFGKTGTAELAVPGEKGYDRTRYMASFLAAAPLDNPRLVVICVIDDPDRRKGHFGGLVAAPVVRDVIDDSLQYLGVPYDQLEENRPKVKSKAAKVAKAD